MFIDIYIRTYIYKYINTYCMYTNKNSRSIDIHVHVYKHTDIFTHIYIYIYILHALL